MNVTEARKGRAINTIYVHLTRACNLRCTYCYFAAGDAMQAELSLDEFRPVFKEIALISPQKVVFTGGEPLLRADFFDLARAFRESDLSRQTRLGLISNGTLIDAQTARQVALIVDEVRISIDGPREVNDKLRGKGAFDGALNAIWHLRNAGLVPGVSITVTARSLPYLSGFLSFLFEEKLITDFHLSPFRPIGRGSQHPELVCSWRAAQLAAAEFWRSHFGEPSRLEDTEAYSLMSCGNCGIGGYLNIYPDGSVYPCHVLSTPEFCLGNVKHTQLSVIIEAADILKRLSSLDFKHIAAGNDRRRELFSRALCLGEVYRDAPEEFAALFGSRI